VLALSGPIWAPQRSKLLACRPVLDEGQLPGAVACGLEQPAPDALTPQRAAAAIWSWAPGHPARGGGSLVRR